MKRGKNKPSGYDAPEIQHCPYCIKPTRFLDSHLTRCNIYQSSLKRGFKPNRSQNKNSSEVRVIKKSAHIEPDSNSKKYKSVSKADGLKEAKRKHLFEKINNLLEHHFLAVDSFYNKECSTYISETEFDRTKANFVKKWMIEFFESTKNKTYTPDLEQALAIGSVTCPTLTVARAGSGKTWTIINRTIFLIKHCSVDPQEILLLAFNKKAAMEIEERLSVLIGEHLPHIMTFHALAYSIVHPEESLLADSQEGGQSLSRALQSVIDDYRLSSDLNSHIKNIMLAHFREDWEKIVRGGYDKNLQEMLEFRRSLPRESLKGEYLKSFGEKIIADFLFEHDIVYKYERNHWWNGINYRPDFTIFKTSKSGLIIEYFGLKGSPDYDEMSQSKRAYWSKKEGWELIEINPLDFNSTNIATFQDNIRRSLEEHGITCNKLSEEEIWDRVKVRAIDRFTRAIVSFIGKCRKSCWDIEDLENNIAVYQFESDIERLFYKAAKQIYHGYINRISETGEDDFDGLMQKAISLINSGSCVFERKTGKFSIKDLRFLSVDEFQDFSELFYRLISSIIKQNTLINLFCVGDDWQAINGFAGSDLKYFRDFQKYFGKHKLLHISTNYRSPKLIVNVGNKLMEGTGKPSTPFKSKLGNIIVADLKELKPTLIEMKAFPGDLISPAVLRIAIPELNNDHSVVLLSRRNALPWYIHNGVNSKVKHELGMLIENLRHYLPDSLKPKLTISTSHKYKGLEKPVVIILDAVARSYPLIHPDWVFSKIFGDNPIKITEEEKRLFYVALTRASEKLFLITEKSFKTIFLEQIEYCQGIPYKFG